jgi:hypothetical protein
MAKCSLFPVTFFALCAMAFCFPVKATEQSIQMTSSLAGSPSEFHQLRSELEGLNGDSADVFSAWAEDNKPALESLNSRQMQSLYRTAREEVAVPVSAGRECSDIPCDKFLSLFQCAIIGCGSCLEYPTYGVYHCVPTPHYAQ